MKFILTFVFIIVSSIGVCAQKSDTKNVDFIGASEDGLFGYFLVKSSVKTNLHVIEFDYIKIYDEHNYLITHANASCKDNTITELSRYGLLGDERMAEANPKPVPGKVKPKTIGELLINKLCKSNEFFE